MKAVSREVASLPGWPVFALRALGNFGGSLGPDVGLGMAIVVVEIVHDGLLQFVDALEDAAADAFSGDLGKEPLDQV